MLSIVPYQKIVFHYEFFNFLLSITYSLNNQYFFPTNIMDLMNCWYIITLEVSIIFHEMFFWKVGSYVGPLVVLACSIIVPNKVLLWWRKIFESNLTYWGCLPFKVKVIMDLIISRLHCVGGEGSCSYHICIQLPYKEGFYAYLLLKNGRKLQA